jgi:hypothetical protein
MMQTFSTQTLDRIEAGLCAAAGRRRGHLLAVSRFGHLIPGNSAAFTLCFTQLYAPLLAADVRFAALLPVRIAVCPQGEGYLLETISCGAFARLLERPDLDTRPLDRVLREVMEEAAHGPDRDAGHPATEDQVNMRAAVPQRIDCRGTKIEELAGTGAIDSQGG